VRGKAVCHVHGPTNLVQRHEVADVDVAELHDPESIERAGKVRDWNLDPNAFQPQTFEGVAVDGSDKWYPSCERCSLAKK
jgi:hypothetical protein